MSRPVRPGHLPFAVPTVTAPHHPAYKSPFPAPPSVPWSHIWWLPVVVVPLFGVLLFANARLNKATPKTGGDGRVVGIVGRMGSGKSYMAVRLAIRKMKRGANMRTNFTMHLEDAPAVNDLRAAGVSRRQVARRLGMPLGRVRVLWGITGTWAKFAGWEDFEDLENAVVVVDEAHTYAPSNKTIQFPDVARFKLSNARKYGLDVYWLTQHENRVNTVLRDHTNLTYLCRSWFTALVFTVVGYEPEYFRRRGHQLERQVYRFNKHVASLYDTLEVLSVDSHLMGDAVMAKAAANAARHNDEMRRRCSHELAGHLRYGACARCHVGAGSDKEVL
jgi:hypothetical protein